MTRHPELPWRRGRHAAHHRRWLAGLVLAAAAAAPAAAAERDGDATRGRLLYENHCTSCHTSQAHVRENRKASTRSDLRKWVERWQGVQGLGWTRRDVDDVAAWLFLRFYDPDRPRASGDEPA